MAWPPPLRYYQAMENKLFLMTTKTGLMAGLTFLAVLTGCMVDRAGGYRGHTQVTATFEDDYDYYPGYETYYSRNRREFVYLEGRTWVRRPSPRGVSVNVFLAAPSVRLDFRDAPEQHHATVIRTYPKTWTRPHSNHSPRQVPPPVVIIQESRAIEPAHPAKPEPPAKHKNRTKEDRPNNKDDDKKGDGHDDDDDDKKGPNRTGGRR